MELRNMMFGNSRGAVPVRRGAWEEDLFAAVNERDPECHPQDREHCQPTFENDVFSLFPYWWGDCECGHEQRAGEWSDAHPHASDCYQTELYAAEEALDARIGYNRPASLFDALDMQQEPLIEGGAVVGAVFTSRARTDDKSEADSKLYDLRQAGLDELYRSLCEKHNIPWNDGHGCAVHCTCSHDAEWEKWSEANNHDATCPMVRPNFYYKPTDYQLDWYKYPLRDSYASRKITTGEWRKMIDHCLSSVLTGELKP